jgi:DNA-binding GntR family transcriptional regulator
MLVPVDPRGQEPPYRQAAAQLRDMIDRGELGPGEVLPSEKALMGQCEIGRSTARRVIALLREEGYVYTVAHRGSYVAQR